MWNDSCRWARHRLPLLAGGELAGPDRRKAERHLIGCPECRGRLESLRGSVAALRSMVAVPAMSADAPSLWPALARQIRESRRPTPSIWTIFEPRPAWIGAGIAAGLLLAGAAVASRTATHLQDKQGVLTAKADPKRPESPVPPPARREVKVGTAVADATPPRSEGEGPSQPPPPAPSNPPRNAPKAPVGGISMPVEATH